MEDSPRKSRGYVRFMDRVVSTIIGDGLTGEGIEGGRAIIVVAVVVVMVVARVVDIP